ncbi:Rne/Rng family ribonuclease [Granulicella sp. 5B5]|uniref:Rne/Rng family ribonuclease n=1 Tax=Granulicella sp. 5B5 TaxID=1617967 RepID=UPI0015F50096|nr:Rne/Rng family ribonuclease [Granulicella sp. 5B5]QMV19455.1 Rne/Rng family ribonuclease [Granulicella sp. 5B5]
MSKEIYISSTPHETRLAIVEKDELTEIYYERENEYTLAGSIYNGRVTRVLPGMQSSFVDIGLERDAFLYITDFMEEAGDSADFESSNGSSAPRSGERRERSSDRGRRDDRDRTRAPQLEVPVADNPPTEDDLLTVDRDATSEEIGEGAPGADGSRRWRGRRGRRRGRGSNGEGSSETVFAAPQSEEAVVDEQPAPEIERSDREDRSDRNSRRRGGRDRRRDDIRERFTPRGLRNDATDEPVSLDATAAPEPLILPGESLSKYRGGSEPTAAASAPVAVSDNMIRPKPSTEVDLSLGWDGGAVLPGESLSRRRESAASAEGESDSSPRGRDRRRERDERRGRGDNGNKQSESTSHTESFAPESVAGLEPSEAVQPAVTSQHEVEDTVLPLGFELHQDGETIEEAPEPIAEFQETITEYEPEEDASASYRVDPVSPRELRQGAPVEELHAVAEPIVEPVDTRSETVLSHEAVEAAEPAFEEPAEIGAPEQPLHFSPGDGVLEEEILDDDDFATPHFHASAIQDETEEETLEHAADLGSMIRDMSIDEITGSQPVELDEDEDDFDIDEEDLEEDQFESAGDEEGDELSGSEVSEAEEDEFAEAGSIEINDNGNGTPDTERAPREGGRRGRRDGRRGGRDRDRGDRGDRGSRDRRGMANSRSGERRGRPSVQASDLPAISDLLKPGQEVLVQIAKEPIAKKGARITSHIALPGRFLVFMPTVSHVGVSRKIESDSERRRLKEILLSEKGDASGGFIVRTAASGASEDELRSDLRFLLNLWADIKTRSESSKSPALIYHDLNLIERILRDQVTDNFSAIWVDTETEYERVLRFLQRFQPSLIRRVKLYTKDTPLFEQFGINEEINKALRSKVWLKSGGSIVINQTEALVAIDINTGKYVGKTARLEDTIVKTNLDAIPEIVRQIRLRDLGGIIIIDFIDMDERKNRNRVMAALEEELKNDRAPSKVLQFNDFGLVAITRKRVKQSLERTLSTTCNICQGTGMTKSPITVCNDIYIEMRKMHKHIEKGDIMLRVHPEVVKQLKSNGGKWLQEMEDLSRKTILVKSDPSLHPEQFDIH